MRSTPSAYSHAQTEIDARQALEAPYYLRVGGLRHFIGFRVGEKHVARLQALSEASGFTRGEILRRVLLSAEIPSARARKQVQDLLRIQGEQKRLGGLLKKALTEHEEKAAQLAVAARLGLVARLVAAVRLAPAGWVALAAPRTPVSEVNVIRTRKRKPIARTRSTLATCSARAARR
jgi:hypothetical protein